MTYNEIEKILKQGKIGLLPNYKGYYEKYKAVVTSRYPNLQFDEVSG